MQLKGEEMTLGEAEELAMKTDYACFAVETKENEINKADAGAFFLSGFEYAQKKMYDSLLKSLYDIWPECPYPESVFPLMKKMKMKL